MPQSFRSIVVSKKDDKFDIDIKDRTIDQLPDDDLLIRVEFSSLNYKDALSAIGAKGVTKIYPHTPGIDAAGIVEQSNNENFPIGSSVIVTGFDLGMDTSGGFSEYIRVPSHWAVKCSSDFSTKEAMMLGTAGMTAGLAILSIADKLPINKSKAVVSGATGGVGSIGVKLLSQLGANVTAITAKMDKKSWLKELGASKVLDRKRFIDSTSHPLSKGKYDIALDVVGGRILSSIIASMNYGGIITTCGNVGGPKFETSVFPFILRGNSLIGIDSAACSIEKKKMIWKNFSSKWRLNGLEKNSKIVSLKNMIPEIEKILNGNQIGRVVLKF